MKLIGHYDLRQQNHTIFSSQESKILHCDIEHINSEKFMANIVASSQMVMGNQNSDSPLTKTLFLECYLPKPFWVPVNTSPKIQIRNLIQINNILMVCYVRNCLQHYVL